MTTTKLPELPKGTYPATYPYVARLIRIFTEHPDDDTSALVLLAYGEACRATAPAEVGDGDARFYRTALASLLRGICRTTHFPQDWEEMEYVQRAQKALATRPAGPDGWQDIESAPRDGTWIVLTSTHNPYARACVRWNGDYFWDDQETARLAKDNIMYTHWQPLPPAPRSNNNG